MFVQIVCDPQSLPKDNFGAQGSVKCVFLSGAGVVDPVNDVDWATVRCGAYGGPLEAMVTLMPIPSGTPGDLNNDGFLDQRFKFDSKDTFLGPGDTVVCTGGTLSSASHSFN